MFRNVEKCRVCEGTNLELFLDLGQQPLANAFLRSAEAAADEKRFPLRVAFCHDCNHVQLMEAVEAGLMFRDYVYVSSTSPVFIKHFEDYARSVYERFALKDKLVVDIGSNDGILLKPFKALGARVLGVDPAVEIAKRATAEGIETMPDFFSVAVANKIIEKHGKASVVTANNAFAHIDNWEEVLDTLDVLLDDEGVFVVEAPYLLDFIEKKYFDTTYHEHYNYLAIRPLARFFARRGFELFDVEKVSSHGGSIRIFAKRKNASHQLSENVGRFGEQELAAGLDKFETYKQYAEDIAAIRVKIKHLLAEFKAQGKRIVGYGAAAKGNTLLNYMEIDSSLLDYVVDDSPYKQGLFTPGTLIPVVPSSRLLEDKPDYIFILAWNFADSIIKKCREQGLTDTKFIVPLPEPAIV